MRSLVAVPLAAGLAWFGWAAQHTTAAGPAAVATGGSPPVVAAQLARAACPGAKDDELVTAVAISIAESGARPDAVSPPNWNGTVDKGIWQINSIHGGTWDATRFLEGPYNAEIMASLSNGCTTWTPWTTYTSGAYQKHLADARAAVSAGGPAAKASSGEPDLGAIARTMGDSGRRQWDRAGQIVEQDGSAGYLDRGYGYIDPGLQAVFDKLAPPSGSRTAGQATGQARKIVDAARAWVGTDFNPGVPFQCTYWVRRVLADAGLTVGVTTQTLDGWWTGVGIANSFGRDQGQVIDRPEDLRPGDVIMFDNTYGSWPAGTITHIGIYVGDGQMVDRPTASAPVKLRPLNTFAFHGGVRLRGN